MFRKLSEEVSVEEMMTLREEGLSNKEIAERLEVSYPTVLRYLGKQPEENRGVYGKLKKPEDVIAPKHTIQMELRETKYKGESARYTLFNTGTIEIWHTLEDEYQAPIRMTADQLQTYIVELMDLYSMMEGEKDG